MGEKIAVRVYLVWVEDESAGQMEFDVVIDKLERKIEGRWPIFGLYRHSANDLSPFLLNPQGDIDFGMSETSDRFWKTDLRNVSIRRGESVKVIEPYDAVSIYTIRKVARLGVEEIV